MQAITYTEARQNLAGTMSKVTEDFEPVLITRSKGGNCVLMSYEQYSSLEETAYLMRSPANAQRLLDSMAELKQGKGIERELIE
ncbi:YoeB-YefM toxin-antitoxin system antitoxin YefM [Actinobacillus pleuropneumoniae]|uniref:YoeB-YefM toxin-antitoxin system antitoxin YefM n=1 Tax=Actinobacillus pleuropneumoniae TaxID=715 RepID=UPI000313CED4|nr:YoeB-YefM toxin-antitoxin system antitoxin YefM [Actinobacillus pleuropneumoniae]UKH22956.1 YoeB-YefM toxin-antitoxin system antitoxin YefM [Actinobacillus pleuropneumoniae]UKH24911.1 YoeB-YefM toxin-antitoxin system antitoxin YefM [Actinobacillus pleuropneumoniae]UKH39411.1 YoeB-YefM toxin-antitoxin system antitoxin YefM [Actinobacillus pleuropneumoniae]UQZ25021.1 YoeB-YefM toxin-antitoxin system antitoxin YefM [Actinobacillus pleuropneumoniae]USQ15907.1 YoeB-YefM toxin-antitoxin system an